MLRSSQRTQRTLTLISAAVVKSHVRDYHLQSYNDNPGRKGFEKTGLRNYPDTKSLCPLAEHALHEHSSSNVGIASIFFVPRCQGLYPQGNPFQCASLRALVSSHMQTQNQSPATNILRQMLDSALYLWFSTMEHIDRNSSSSTAVVMDTMAVSLISRTII